MLAVYIAGPYRAKSGWLVELNIRRAEMIAFQVIGAGAVPVCPHTMFRFFNGIKTDEFWINATLELLKRCDAILLLNEWEHSEGSRGERAYALDHNMPIFYQHDIVALYHWLKVPLCHAPPPSTPDQLLLGLSDEPAKEENELDSLGLFTNKYDFPGAL